MTADDVVLVPTAGGHQLAARFFAPGSGGGAARGAVLIVPAMGVAQSYYAAFAAWLAEQGFVAATFDYQGIGESRRGSLRGVRADIVSWASCDCAAMIDAVAARAPGQPFYWIGHSLGGQILPFVPNRERLAKVITIAAGSGYWRDHAPRLRRRVWWLWYVVVPLAVRLMGYFPGRRLGAVGDLPRAAMEQWRRWCLDRDYAAGAEGPAARAAYSAVRTPIVSLSFTDDEFMSARNIEALYDLYSGAPKVMTRIDPRDAGERRIGHFGFFRPQYQRSLWRPYLLPALVC
jgi:predicted alpha/beta hydrolase